MNINSQLLGTTEEHIALNLDVPLHKEAAEAFAYLKKQASERGFELSLASGFRSFERQMKIWNGKASGERPLYDAHGELLEANELTNKEKVFAILRWSALPGASRHHWGTDADVYDAAALPDGETLQLTVAETVSGGFFAPMHRWLDSWLPSSEFYRPYAHDRGGVAPEPWHLSYLPLARSYMSALTADVIYKQIENSNLLLQREVLANFDEIFQRFIKC